MNERTILALMGVILFCLCFCQLGQASESTIVVQRVSQPPRVDGRLDDPAWQNLKRHSGFSIAGYPDTAPLAQTSFMVCHDGANLYFAVICEEPHTEKLVQNIRERDGRVWDDDDIEIFLDPSGARVEYFQFLVNSIGTLADLAGFQGGIVRMMAWDSNAQAASSVGDGYWQAEVKIPFFNLNIQSSDPNWLFNVARGRFAHIREGSSFAPLATASFHAPDRFRVLRLEDIDLDPFLWKIHLPHDKQVFYDDGKLFYSFEVTVENRGNKLQMVQVYAKLPGTVSERVVLPLNPGQAATRPIRLLAKNEGRQTLAIAIADAHSAERIYRVEQFPVLIEYYPIRINVTTPWYRNLIFSDQKFDQIEMTITSHLPEKKLSGKNFEIELIDAQGKKISSRSVPAGLKIQVTLPIPPLEVGKYHLSVRLPREGGAYYTSSTSIQKLPHLPGQVRLDRDGTVVLDGQRTFISGWWMHIDPRPELRFAWRHKFLPRHDEVKMQQRLDEIYAQGNRVLISATPKWDDYMQRRTPLSEEERQWVQSFVRRWREHPAIFGWVIAEEPEVKNTLPAYLEGLHEAIREADPHHPTVILNNTIDGIRRYARAADIFFPNPYPDFKQGGYAAIPIEMITRFANAVHEIGKPFWLCPQWFNYALVRGGRAGGSRAPTFTELRNMYWQAIIAQAKGIMGYTKKYQGRYPQFRLGIPFLAREALAIEEAVLAPDDATPISFKTTSDLVFHSLRKVKGHYYLFVVNCETTPQDISFKLPVDELFVMSEGRSIKARDGVFHDTLPLYGTAIYTTDRSAATRYSLAELEMNMEKMRASFKKPGNLAYWGLGAQARASSARPGCENWYMELLNDGVTEKEFLAWHDITPYRFPDWVEIELARESPVGRVVLYSNLTDFDIQVRTANNFVTVAKVTGNKERVREITFPPVKTRCIRIVIHGAQDKRCAVWEIEIYSK